MDLRRDVFKGTGLFANRINKSVESGVKLRQNYATLFCLSALHMHQGLSAHLLHLSK